MAIQGLTTGRAPATPERRREPLGPIATPLHTIIVQQPGVSGLARNAILGWQCCTVKPCMTEVQQNVCMPLQRFFFSPCLNPW